MIAWKALVGKYLQRVKKATRNVAKNAVTVVLNNSHCKG